MYIVIQNIWRTQRNNKNKINQQILQPPLNRIPQRLSFLMPPAHFDKQSQTDGSPQSSHVAVPCSATISCTLSVSYVSELSAWLWPQFNIAWHRSSSLLQIFAGQQSAPLFCRLISLKHYVILYFMCFRLPDLCPKSSGTSTLVFVKGTWRTRVAPNLSSANFKFPTPQASQWKLSLSL